MNPRVGKQIIITLIFFVILGSLIYFLVIYPNSPKFTCFNNRQNKNEESVDCGGVCEKQCLVIRPFEIVSQRIFSIGSDFDYDFLVEIKNPNSDFGASDVVYELKLVNDKEEVVFSMTGLTFLMPGQTKYEIISPIRTGESVSGPNFRIKNEIWQKLDEFIPQNLFLVKNREYSLLNPDEGFSKLEGTIFNDSNFDFDKVDLAVVLFDKDSTPLAVNKTDIRTFKSKTARHFEVKWSKVFEGLVHRIDIQASTNVFRNENFIKEYGTQEEFQKF